MLILYLANLVRIRKLLIALNCWNRLVRFNCQLRIFKVCCGLISRWLSALFQIRNCSFRAKSYFVVSWPLGLLFFCLNFTWWSGFLNLTLNPFLVMWRCRWVHDYLRWLAPASSDLSFTISFAFLQRWNLVSVVYVSPLATIIDYVWTV